MKIKIGLLLGLGLGVCAAAAAGTDPVWEAVFDLSNLARVETAEQTLREAGEPGIRTLIRAARLGRERIVLDRAADAAGCKSVLTMHSSMWKAQEAQFMGSAHGPAAELAVRLLPEHPKLQAELLASQVLFERRLALLSLYSSPDRLAEAIEQLAEKSSPGMLHTTGLLQWCLRNPKEGFSDIQRERALAALERLEDASLILVPDADCEAAAFADGELVSGLLSGQVQNHSSVIRDGVWRHRLRAASGDTYGMSSACVVATYDAARKKGEPLSMLANLLITIAEDLTAAPALRKRATEMLIPDLTHFSAFQNQSMAARLVNAGFQVPIRIAYEDATRLPDALLTEAAIRQGSDLAREAVVGSLVCPGVFGDKVALLGFSTDALAAQRAVEIATHCPRARPAATAALIRSGDSRASAILFVLLISPGFLAGSSENLAAALNEHGTQQMRKLLRDMARAGNHKARRLLGAWQTAERGRGKP
jgi:hypothetical protein